MKQQVNQLNSLVLAYIGDAIYEVHVRHHLIKSGQINPHELQQRAVHYVSAKAQSEIMHHLLTIDFLENEEKGVVRRGRNAKSNSIPKNASVQAYRYATAFEALLGYHYLKENEARLHELIHLSLQYVVNKQRDE